jgi:hypothetical protein
MLEQLHPLTPVPPRAIEFESKDWSATEGAGGIIVPDIN